MDVKLLEILVCPLCRGKLHYDREVQELICKFDKLAFPIHGDVPIMREDAAREIC